MAFKRRPRTISVQGSRQLELPHHISFSSNETLKRCARSWFLKYLAKAPQRPALWLAGGSAVHEVTEEWDRDNYFIVGAEPLDIQEMWREKFDAQLDRLRAKDPNEWNWRRSQSEPIEAWNQMGPQFVQSYIDWRQRSPYEIWTTPDGGPAIELDISGHLPGCPVEIKAYLDRVFHDPLFDRLIIVDLKTSKRPPATVDQFAVYAALVEVKYGVRPKLGVAFMNRKGSLGTPWDLEGVTPEAVGTVFGEAWEQILSGQFPVDETGKACFLCDVSSSCAFKGGPLAAQYDPASPGYAPPF